MENECMENECMENECMENERMQNNGYKSKACAIFSVFITGIYLIACTMILLCREQVLFRTFRRNQSSVRDHFCGSSLYCSEGGSGASVCHCFPMQQT